MAEYTNPTPLTDSQLEDMRASNAGRDGNATSVLRAWQIGAIIARIDSDAAALRWAAGDDTGVSSKAIALRMAGGTPRWQSFPRDGSDLGRCLRLLEKIPAWLKRLPEMAAVSGPWAQLVEKWEELSGLYRQEEKGLPEDCGTTYLRMQELIEQGIRTDPRVTITWEHKGRIGSYQVRNDG